MLELPRRWGRRRLARGGQLADSPVENLVLSDLYCEGEVCALGSDAASRWLAAVWIVQVVDSGVVPVLGSVRRFTDVGDDHPYVAYIERAAELGITQGCGDGSRFCPDDTVTRGQMAAFLVRGFDLPAPLVRPAFDDIGAGHRFASEIAAIAAAGITVGCGDGSNYCDTATITQRQLRTMLTRGQAARVPMVDPVEATATTTTARPTAIPVRRSAATTTTTTTTTTTLPPAPMDRLVNDLVAISRTGVAAINAEIDVLTGDWCDAGCHNVIVTRDPSVGSARWDVNRIIYEVPQGAQAPSSVSFDYATDNSIADATVTIQITVVQPPMLVGYQDIAVGSEFWCAINAQRSIECQGDDSYGVISMIPDGSDYVEIAAGTSHVCARRIDNTIACWGDNSAGQADDPTEMFKTLSLGWALSCGIKNDNTLKCWGVDVAGTLDPPEDTYKSLAVGQFAGCAITTNNGVECWGEQIHGTAVDNAIAITTSGVNVCAIKLSNMVECWGSDTSGETDTSSITDTFKSLSSGNEFNCGIKSNGMITCWGKSDDQRTNSPSGTFKLISSFGTASCAITTDGQRQCWGTPAF